MHFFDSAAAVAAVFLALGSTVSAHGYLKYIDTAGVRYPAWQVGQDDYVTPIPTLTRFSRRIKDSGPVPDFRTSNITCNVGGNIPTDAFISVAPGQQVKFVWDQWGSSHAGPVMTYLAKCTPNCASFKGDSGAVWTKIDQMGWDQTQSPPWASDKLATLGASWTVTIPPGLVAGEYLIRHEILGLHVAGTEMGAQFYPSCAQLKVTGSGTVTLPGQVALPGAYEPKDPGILVELWKYGTLLFNYTAPGGPVWSGAGAQLNGSGSVPAPTSTATWTGSVATPGPVVSSSSAATSSTTTTSKTTTTAAAGTTTKTTTTTAPATTTTQAAGTVQAWGQCGGINHTGATGCVSGYNCKVINDYYHQCVPN